MNWPSASFLVKVKVEVKVKVYCLLRSRRSSATLSYDLTYWHNSSQNPARLNGRL